MRLHIVDLLVNQCFRLEKKVPNEGHVTLEGLPRTFANSHISRAWLHFNDVLHIVLSGCHRSGYLIQVAYVR